MIIDELFEGPQLCPECGGISFSDLILAEKKDACYYKVKASAKVWPSAYASGRLVQCRKKGAANYGKSKNEGVAEGIDTEELANEVYAEFERIYPNLARRADERTVHAAIMDVLNYGGDSDPSALAQDVARAVKQEMQQGMAEGQLDEISQDTARSYAQKATQSKKDLTNQTFRKGADTDKLNKKIQNRQQGMNRAQLDRRYYKDEQGVAEQQELDEKWSQKYKKSINCANPKGFSQKAHCAGRKKNEDVEESLGKQIHSTFQTMGDSFSDAHLAKGISYFLQGRHQEGENWLRGKIPPEAQAAVFGKLKTLQAQGGVDVNKNPSVQQYIDDKLVPWVKSQIQQGVAETRRGQIPMSNLKPGETDNYEPEDIEGYKKLPQYQQGYQAQQKAGKTLIQQSPFTFGSDQDWAYRRGAFDAQQAAMFANFGKSKPLTTEAGEQQKGADYRDPKEVDYDDEYDAMVARVKKLAGLGPLKTVYDPTKRVYRNIPTAVQPKK